MYFLKNASCAIFLFGSMIVAQNAPQNTSNQDTLDLIQNAKQQFLDEVVLIDSRIERKREASGKPVITITAATLAPFQGQSLGAVLSQYAGIDILGHQTYLGQPLTYTIRGGRNDKVLVLIDGVRVSDPSFIDSSFDLNLIPIENIERVEILKGASSTLYGSAAAAGVISIQTKKGMDTPQLTWLGATGTLTDADRTFKGLTTYSNRLSYANDWGTAGYQLHYSQQYTDGISAVIGSEKDPFSRHNIGLRLYKLQQSDWDWDFNIAKTKTTSHYDSAYPIEDAPFRLLSDQLRISFAPRYRYGNGQINLNVGYQKSDRDFESNFSSVFSGSNYFVDLFDTHRFNKKWAIVSGWNFQKSISEIESIQQSTIQNDVYINGIYEGKNLHLNAGIRHNIHSDYGGQWTYNFNPSLHFKKALTNYKLFMSLSSAFIAPSLYQLYSTFGDENLQPAKTNTAEAGFLLGTQVGAFEGVIFKRKERPSLIFDNNTYKYANSSDAVFYSGFEFRYQHLFNQKYRTTLNYTFTDTEGGDLRRIPKHSLAANLGIQWSNKWSSMLGYQFVGVRFASDGLSELDAYGILNLNIGYKLQKPKIEFGFALTNALNKKFVVFQNYTTQGRNFLFTVRWDFL